MRGVLLSPAFPVRLQLEKAIVPVETLFIVGVLVAIVEPTMFNVPVEVFRIMPDAV